MARKPKASEGATGFGEDRQASIESNSGFSDRTPGGPTGSERRLLKLGPDGRVLIPADWRQAMDLKDTDTLVAHLEDGELRLHGSLVGVRRAQKRARELLTLGPSVVDELIADRRNEAKREAGDG